MKYGILEVTPAVTLEKDKWVVFLPGKKGIEIRSKREVEILSIFKIIFEMTVSDYYLEIGQIEEENYLIAKKRDVLSVRGYDLIGVYSKEAIVSLVTGGLYIGSEKIKMAKYQILGNVIKELEE